MKVIINIKNKIVNINTIIIDIKMNIFINKE